MPIGSGARGRPGVLGVPALTGSGAFTGGDGGGSVRNSGGVGGPQQSGVLRSGGVGGNRKSLPFKSPALSRAGFFISGVTKDDTGAPLAACVVKLFLRDTNQFIEQQTSDGSGVFRFGATAGPYFIVAWGPTGAVAGVTLDTLTGT